ncbi:hypothetical protein BDW22DRAFT_1349350 [Trametopsis cervina]|nr:hypothetical protein BDW22DRAFT_1349350 [Trametopsis cervina]
MARTKHSAKKAVGGKAPRQPLGSVESVPVAEPVGAQWEPAGIAEADPWCCVCLNGGDLIECTCGRTLCNGCAPQLKTVPPGVLGLAIFRCPECDKQGDRKGKSYLGLYYEDGAPVFPDGLIVQHDNYVPLTPRFCLPSIFILDLHIPPLDPRGGPGHLLSERLWPWYAPFKDKDRLKYLAHPLDFTKARSIDQQQSRLKKLAKQIAQYEHLILFLCAHADEDRGDIIYMPDGACTIDEPLTATKKSFFLLACGGTVLHQESFDQLKGQINLLNIDHAFAFAAQGLISHTTYPFVEGYVEQTILRNLDPARHLEKVLDQCYVVGRHTAIVWMRPNLSAVRFTWVERAIWSWSAPKVEAAETLVFSCKTILTDKRQCDKTLRFPKNPHTMLVKKGNMGTWIKEGGRD